MGILDNAIAGVTSLVTKANQERPIMQQTSAGNFGYGMGGGGVQQGNRVSQMEAMGSVGWIFAVVDRIATSVAANKWKLYRSRPNGEAEEIFEHPLLDLWRKVNPFYTRQEFVEVGAQHFELTGETWWVLLYSSAGIPVELWPIRPDRIRPIPHRENYIAGYLYTIGSEHIPLATTDVIYFRRPHPLDSYRGIGQVQSILWDVESEKMAAQYERNFYRNSAEPGGIIEYPNQLSENQFEELSLRWKEQHQGVSNAHRVAIIEGGVWKDRKLTQRDMQFVPTRENNRDIIIGAWGIPPSVIGIVDATNRANAEAGEYLFAKDIVKPRLERIKSVVNERLVPLFRDPSLFLDFDDPVPQNKEHNLNEAERGYTSGILSQNEARRRLGEGEVDGGDEFKPQGGGGLFGLGVQEPSSPSYTLHRISEPQATKAEDPQVTHARAMLVSWTRRLAQERDALVAHLSQFKMLSPAIPDRQAGLPISHRKIELMDVDTFDWDWELKYGEEVVEELTEAFTAVLLTEAPLMAPGEAIRLATQYAEQRGALLLRLTGEINLVEFTRERVRTLVAHNIDAGEGLGTLQKALRDDFAFSKERATNVARTETATALGQGSQQAALVEGLEEKHWVTQADDRVSKEICAPNERQGWISIRDPFQSGHDVIPGHPQCRCRVRYRSVPASDVVAEVRCPVCNKLLGRGVKVGSTLHCRRCGVMRNVN